MEVEILSTVTRGGSTRFVYRAGNGPKRALELPGEVAPSVAVETIRAALGTAVERLRDNPETEPENEPEKDEAPETEPKSDRAAPKTQKPRMQIKKKGR